MSQSLVKLTPNQKQTHQYLTAFGLDKQMFLESVCEGYGEYANTPACCSPIEPGTRAYFAIVRGLRQKLLAEHNWQCNDDDNFPLSISPCGATCIGFSSAKKVGRARFTPRLKHQKGPVFEAASVVNSQIQLDLFNVLPQEGEPLENENAQPSTKRRDLRVLLFEIDQKHSTVYYELSRPVLNNGNLTWEDRIIFEPVPFDVALLGVELDEDEDVDAFDDFDVNPLP